MEAPEELAVANVETAIASQSSHFLPNASGFQIVGGQFVLGNVNNHPPVRPVSPPGPAQASPSLSTNSTASSSPPARILAESEVYRNQLLYQKRGFPLYIPEPQRNPAEYRTKGVRIGDVGRVTPEGAFDFLFNIYCSSEHPRNSNRVPDNFAPLEPAYLAEDLFHVDYEAGDYVSTATIQEPDVGEGDFDSSVFPGGEFLFNCHGPDGALLALPHGSHLEKLENLEAMRRYAAKHAESWYKYINAPAPEGRGRRLVNGFLYLITGCEKSQSWGMASFQNVAVEREFKVSFKPQPPADDYRWRRGTPARTKRSIQGVQNSTNHTLFLHGFSISLGEGIWGKLSGGVSVGQIVDSPFHQSESDFIPFGAQGSGSSSFALGLFRCGGHSGGRTKAAQDGDEVQISELSPAPSVFHPSQIINEYLLGKFSQTTVAITHDDDWCRIFQEYGPEYDAQDPSGSLHRIIQGNLNFEQLPVAEDDGAIYFVSKPGLARELYEMSLRKQRKIQVYTPSATIRQNDPNSCASPSPFPLPRTIMAEDYTPSIHIEPPPDSEEQDLFASLGAFDNFDNYGSTSQSGMNDGYPTVPAPFIQGSESPSISKFSTSDGLYLQTDYRYNPSGSNSGRSSPIDAYSPASSFSGDIFPDDFSSDDFAPHWSQHSQRFSGHSSPALSPSLSPLTSAFDGFALDERYPSGF